MIQLAWIQLDDEFTRAVALPVYLIKYFRDDPDGTGTIVTFTDGTEMKFTQGVTTIATAIDALWDESQA